MAITRYTLNLKQRRLSIYKSNGAHYPLFIKWDNGRFFLNFFTLFINTLIFKLKGS